MRSTTRASIKCDTVLAPPSTRIFLKPWRNNVSAMAIGSRTPADEFNYQRLGAARHLPFLVPDDKTTNAVGGEPTRRWIEATIRIDHHTGRLTPGNPTNRQQWIVGHDRANTNENGVDMRTEAVQMIEGA